MHRVSGQFRSRRVGNGKRVLEVSLFLLLLLDLKDFTNATDPEFHSSLIAIKKLATVEEEIYQALKLYVSTLQDRLLLAQKYLDERDGNNFQFDNLSHANNNSEEGVQTNGLGTRIMDKAILYDSISSNPLRTFQLIRRLTSDLPRLEKDMQKDHEKKFLHALKNIRKGASLPGKNDLETVTQGILRVQDAYNLDINEFTEGTFQHLDTNSSLSASDCVSIGTYGLNADIYTRALEWLQRAYFLSRERGDKSVSPEKVLGMLKNAVSKHNKAWLASKKNPYVYRELVKEESVMQGPVKRRQRVLDREKEEFKLYHSEPKFADLINFAALCRGETLHNPSYDKNLKCWLDISSLINTLSPLKVESLHVNPPVLQIYDLISDQLIKEILDHAQPHLAQSKVHGKTMESHRTVSASRTSSSTWVNTPKTLSKLQNVYAKLRTVSELDTKAHESCEDFQVTNYGIMGHYNPHLDTILNRELFPQMGKEEVQKGDRLATIMFYLSDVLRGGYTTFPRIGVAAKPVKGSALLWFNMKRNGEPDPWSLHGGCPVLFGHKWIANQWIRANSQMFSRKCEAMA